MPQIERPNYTQIPNSILGDIEKGNVFIPGIIAELSGAETKLLMAVCRITFGFHQNQRRASVEDMIILTKLSRQGVYDAAKRLEDLNLIIRLKDGGVTLWQVVVNSVDNDYCQADVNSVDEGVNSVDTECQLSRHPSKKETIKETNKINKRAPAIPAVQVFVEVTGKYYLNSTQIKVLSDKIGDTPAALEKWRDVVTQWNLCGHKLTNVQGMLDWYTDGIPKYKNGATNGYKDQTTYQSGTTQGGHSSPAGQNADQTGRVLTGNAKRLSEAIKSRARGSGGGT